MKKYLPMLSLCLSLLALGSLQGPSLHAAETPAPIPLVVAESDLFEVVGRLDQNGLVLHVDRSMTNEPVLAAMLEVEAGDRKAVAQFRPAEGDYLIADNAWLEPLRQIGEHPLSFTVIATDDSDLLSGELQVVGPSTAAAGAIPLPGSRWLVGLLLLLTGIAGLLLLRRRRKRHALRQGGAA
jgi:hypothetical protein